jgi:hypothetical protein
MELVNSRGVATRFTYLALADIVTHLRYKLTAAGLRVREWSAIVGAEMVPVQARGRY